MAKKAGKVQPQAVPQADVRKAEPDYAWSSDREGGVLTTPFGNELYEYDSATNEYRSPYTGRWQPMGEDSFSEWQSDATERYVNDIWPIEEKCELGAKYGIYYPGVPAFDGKYGNVPYVAIAEDVALPYDSFMRAKDRIDGARDYDEERMGLAEVAKHIVKGIKDVPDDDRNIGSRFTVHGRTVTVPRSDFEYISALVPEGPDLDKLANPHGPRTELSRRAPAVPETAAYQADDVSLGG